MMNSGQMKKTKPHVIETIQLYLIDIRYGSEDDFQREQWL